MKIIAVGGGKGGVGKSLVSANLSLSLAKRGFRTAAVDLDLGGANLHTCLGVPLPPVGLTDFVTRRASSLGEIMVPSGVENLWLIAGANDALDAANPRYQQKQKLLRHLGKLDLDYLVLDLGAGTQFNVLDFFLLADHGLLVLLPEPTSIENAYRFVKAAFFRRLEQVQEHFAIGEEVAAALSTREGMSRTPFDLYRAVAEKDPVLAAQLQQEMDGFRVKLIVNQVRSEADLGVAPAVVNAWKKFFGIQMDTLGSIPYDDEAWRAVRRRRPIVVDRPESEAAAAISGIVDRMIA